MDPTALNYSNVIQSALTINTVATVNRVLYTQNLVRGGEKSFAQVAFCFELQSATYTGCTAALIQGIKTVYFLRQTY